MGFVVTYNNEHLDDDDKKDTVRLAGQADFDAF